MAAESEELLPGIEQVLRQFSRPIVVDIGGEFHHAREFKKAGHSGTLICANPDFSLVKAYGNVLFVPGGYEGVSLPADTADEVQLNMIMTYGPGGAEYKPLNRVLQTIETARRFANQGAWLEVLDMNPTTELVAARLPKKGHTIEYRPLDMENDDDRVLCHERSYHAAMHQDVGLGFLRIQL